MLRKLVLSLLAALTVFLSIAPGTVALAQSEDSVWYNQPFAEWYIKVYDLDSSPANEIYGERYTAAQVQWVFWSVYAELLNLPYTIIGIQPRPNVCFAQLTMGTIDLTGCIKAGEDTIRAIMGKAGLASGGQNTFVADSHDNDSMWKSIFTEERSFSGITYVKSLARKFQLVPEVQAQTTGGFGFGALGPITIFWKMTRNISYFLFIIVTVVFAFMIMFRVKLSPQTVIGVQSALPKLVSALILVTFSFAIAGFMVDLIYVLMGVVSTLIHGSLGSLISGTSLTPLGAKAIFEFINGTTFMQDKALAIVGYYAIYIVLYFLATIVALLASVGTAFSGLTINITGLLLSVILVVGTIVIFFILLINIFKTIWMLFKTLAAVYGLVILAPLQITAGTLFPQMGIGPWLKSLFSKLIVFPLTGLMLFFSYLLINGSVILSIQGLIEKNTFTALFTDLTQALIPKIGIDFHWGDFFKGELWGPPMLGNAASASGIAFLLMSVGCIMAIPKIASMIETFMAGKGLGMGSAIGEAFGPVKAGWGMTGAPIVKGIQEHEGVERQRQIYRWMGSQIEKQVAAGRDVPKFLRSMFPAQDTPQGH